MKSLKEKVFKNPIISTLLAEDNHILQKIFYIMLKNLGYEVDIVETGKAALAMALRKTYSVIFMDIGLPDMNGLEVTTELRNKRNGIYTPIIAITAHAKEVIKTECLTSGINEVLTKPVSQEQLQRAIFRWRKKQLT